MPKILVLGTGFAACSAVEALRKRNRHVEIVMIGRSPDFVYLPSLIWLPTGLRKPDDLRFSLDGFLTRTMAKFHAGEVTGLADGGRTVKTTTGDVTGDGVIIATGGRFIKKLPGIEHAITPCEGIEPTMRFTERLNAMDGGTVAFGFSGNPKEPSAMRGGPMFEFLFGVDRMLRKQRRRDKFTLVFFSPAPKPGIRLSEKAASKLLIEMRKRGIKVHVGHKMVRFEEDKVVTEDAEIHSDLTLFMPGMTGNKWFDDTNLPRSEGGLVRADEQCRVEGWDKVYVAGDSGSFPGPDWMPKQAHMADLQADCAAANLLQELKGREPGHTFRTELVCIIDEGTTGSLVARRPGMTLMLPSSPVWHWSKRWFERLYLRRFR